MAVEPPRRVWFRAAGAPLLLGRLVIDQPEATSAPVVLEVDRRPLVYDSGASELDLAAGRYTLRAVGVAGELGTGAVTVIAGHQVHCAWGGSLFACDEPFEVDAEVRSELEARQAADGPPVRMRRVRSEQTVVVGDHPFFGGEASLVEERWIPDLSAGDSDAAEVFPGVVAPAVATVAVPWTVSAVDGKWSRVSLDGRTVGLLQVSREFTVTVPPGEHEVTLADFLGRPWWTGRLLFREGQGLVCEVAEDEAIACEEPIQSPPEEEPAESDSPVMR